MNNPAISIKNLFFAYEDVPILDIDHLQIQKGSFTGVIGPNGGGKTTLLKILMGFLKPLQGNIQILGLEPEASRSKIGYVPQVHKCDRDFPITVLELVLLGALDTKTLFGITSTSIKKKAMSIMDELGLTPHIHKTFGSLSGGLAQRALLARALLSDPEILFLDEPTANVDPDSTKLIMDKLQSLQEKKTILIVTHDLNTIAERVHSVLCVQGKITHFDPQKICKHFSFGLYHAPLLNPNSKELQ